VSQLTLDDPDVMRWIYKQDLSGDLGFNLKAGAAVLALAI